MPARLGQPQHDTIDGIPDPAENPSLFGHAETRQALAESYRAGKLHHALLLAGPAGIGKATLAFHLAYHVLRYPVPATAPAELVTPDPQSPLFRSIAQGAHPSVLHLTRPANERSKGFKTMLTVDEIRKVNRFLSMTAHDGAWRIVIVDPADDMNANAANALLKNLEEPPARTVFALIAHSPGRLLPTIRSRCRMMRMGTLADGDLADALSALGLPLPDKPDERTRLAQRAGGSVRGAVLLTQYGGLEIAEAVDHALDGGAFDLVHASRLADAVTARDQSMQFDLFNEYLLDTLSARAEAVAARGDSVGAGRIAELWQEVGKAVVETVTFNLDKRQHVIGLLQKLHRELGSRSPA